MSAKKDTLPPRLSRRRPTKSSLDSVRSFPLRSGYAAFGVPLCRGADRVLEMLPQGSYRLARLADRYGAEVEMQSVLSQLAGDCSQRDVRVRVHDFCGEFFPDLSSGRPPDLPRAAPIRPKLRAAK